jgi:hypothetical protein
MGCRSAMTNLHRWPVRKELQRLQEAPMKAVPVFRTLRGGVAAQSASISYRSHDAGADSDEGAAASDGPAFPPGPATWDGAGFCSGGCGYLHDESISLSLTLNLRAYES